MGKRVDFGTDWSQVAAKWYLGLVPPVRPEMGWRSLGVLEAHFPEHLDKILASQASGIAVMNPLIELGLIIDACQKFNGFDSVLKRFKSGERSAYSELALAAALHKLGYTPIFEPFLNGKRPDLMFTAQRNIYVEIICPDQSEVMKGAFAEMAQLAHVVMEANPGRHIDIYLISDQIIETSEPILEFTTCVLALPSTIKEIPGIAFVRVEQFRPNATAFNPVPGDVRPLIFHSSVQTSTDSSPGRRVTIQASITDNRAQRLMTAESHHFSRDEANILAMDLSGVSGNAQGWATLVKRCFQPTRNRRFGANLLFDQFTDVSGIGWHCSVLPNPYAIQPIPAIVLQDLQQLDGFCFQTSEV